MSDVPPRRRYAVEVLVSHRPGSRDWTWADEAADLIERDGPALDELIRSVATEGVREPVLLGDDGRVWDGHHRIIAALIVGTPVPVEYGTGGGSDA